MRQFTRFLVPLAVLLYSTGTQAEPVDSLSAGPNSASPLDITAPKAPRPPTAQSGTLVSRNGAGRTASMRLRVKLAAGGYPAWLIDAYLPVSIAHGLPIAPTTTTTAAQSSTTWWASGWGIPSASTSEQAHTTPSIQPEPEGAEQPNPRIEDAHTKPTPEDKGTPVPANPTFATSPIASSERDGPATGKPLQLGNWIWWLFLGAAALLPLGLVFSARNIQPARPAGANLREPPSSARPRMEGDHVRGRSGKSARFTERPIEEASLSLEANGSVSVETADECRRLAKECLSRAESMNSQFSRSYWRSLSKGWRDLADEVDPVSWSAIYSSFGVHDVKDVKTHRTLTPHRTNITG